MVNLLYYAAWTALAIGALWVALRWLMPFVLAFVTAALLQRPLRWLAARTRVSRGFLSGLLVVLLVAAVAAAASVPRERHHASAPVNSAAGSPTRRTAQSFAVRHFRHVASST